MSAPSTTREPPRAAKPGYLRLAPAAIVFFGFALRLYRLNRQSVGFDEAFSLAACRAPVVEMMRRLIEDFVHPPLHYLVLRGWMDVFGSGVWTARLLSAVFGTLAIALLYGVAKDLFDRRTALFASLFLAVSQLGIMFSQEARPYAQFLFLFLACWRLFIEALHTRSARLWWAFAGVSVLLIYTHYFGFLVLGTLAVFAFGYRKHYRIPVVWWAGGAAVVLFAYMPWLTSGIFEAAAHSAKTFSGKQAFWSVGASTFFTALNFFNNGKPAGLLDSSPLWAFAAGALLFTAPAALAIFTARAGRERQNVTLAAMLWVLPVLGAIAAGLAHFQYNVRYVAFCAAPYYVLVGRGISAIRPAGLRSALVATALLYTANSLRANYFMPTKEDFRAAGAYVMRNRQPGDCVAFFPGPSVPSQWIIEQPNDGSLRLLERRDFTSALPGCGRVWAVSWSVSGNPWQWARGKEERKALESTHRETGEKQFFWVRVAMYARKAEE